MPEDTKKPRTLPAPAPSGPPLEKVAPSQVAHGTPPGAVFVRQCPECGALKQTADQTGETPCADCAPPAKAHQLPQEEKAGPGRVLGPGGVPDVDLALSDVPVHKRTPSGR